MQLVAPIYLIELCRYGKPVVITGFGLVTQGNAPNFVPFDSTSVANDSSTSTTPSRKRFATPAGPNLGVTDSQRDDAYMQWFGGVWHFIVLLIEADRIRH